MTTTEERIKNKIQARGSAFKTLSQAYANISEKKAAEKTTNVKKK